MEKKIFIVLFIFFLFTNIAFSEDIDAPTDVPAASHSAFIFNTNNLLLDLDSYQGGVGFKLLLDNQYAFRFLIDGYYSNSLNTFSFTLGTAFEGHFTPYDMISPYWGAFIDGGYLTQSVITDNENWTTDKSIPFSIGAILGVEVFIFEYLSVFAEYNLIGKFLVEISEFSENGTITTTEPAYSSEIDTSIGNNSSIGITIYLDDVVEIEK